MQVKIGDLGLARPAAVGTRCWGALCGTPAYMAPEVLDRKGHGAPSDIWAWGCIMYEVLTGSPPFEAAEGRSCMGASARHGTRCPPASRPVPEPSWGACCSPTPQHEPASGRCWSTDSSPRASRRTRCHPTPAAPCPSSAC
eukprot:XP_027327640.1 inactive serine/threonine-protein kinase PLK5-like [Anas platyrhynchos]